MDKGGEVNADLTQNKTCIFHSVCASLVLAFELLPKGIGDFARQHRSMLNDVHPLAVDSVKQPSSAMLPAFFYASKALE